MILQSGINWENLFSNVRERMTTTRKLDFERIADFISQNSPELKEKTIIDADSALYGMLILPGTDAKPYFVGNPPLWHENPVNDNEYVWGLNRMEHWKTLMHAYFLTKDLRYANKVINELNNWIEVCPPLSLDEDEVVYWAATPWRPLEAGIRMYSTWSWVFEALFYVDLMTSDLLEKFTKSVHDHGVLLETISPRLFPNANHNHYFMENLGLMHIAGMLPELKYAKRWKQHAIRELTRCVDKQFSIDGGHIEGCPHYHDLCVFLLRTSITSAKRYGFEFPDSNLEKARKAVDYSMYAMRPSGTVVPWGDSDVDAPSSCPAVDGYLMLGDRMWIDLMLKIGKKEKIQNTLWRYLWELPNIDKLIQDKAFFEPKPVSIPTVNYQRGLDQVTMRTGWDSNALSVFFACRLPVYNAHAHIDPMAFDFMAGGKPLLVDPGRFCYREDENRHLFKSASWHNTVTVNSREPFEYIDSWHYGEQKSGNVCWVQEQSDVLAAQAVQYSYEPVMHKRTIAILNSSVLLILDKLDALSETDIVQMYFHFDSEVVKLDDHNHTAKSKDVSVIYSDELSAHLEPGLVSDFGDVARNSVRLCLNDNGGSVGTRIYVTLCVPSGVNASMQKAMLKNNEIICDITINSQYINLVSDDCGIKNTCKF